VIDHDLADLLERSADRVPVGAPPVSSMVVAAAGLRRRRAMRRVTTAVVVSAAIVAGGTAVVAGVRGDPTDAGDPMGHRNTPSQVVAPVPSGSRLVGIGHSAIAIPQDWSTNAIHCGVATEPTVVIDVTIIETCGIGQPVVFDNVWIERGSNPNIFHPTGDIEIDGVIAQRDEVSCIDVGGSRQLCSATVFVPSADASYRAQADTRQRVDEILSWIRIIPDEVAVPGFGAANLEHQDDDAGEHYRAQLAEAGLEVQVRTEPGPGAKPGYVLDVVPRPGTMLTPGMAVTMTEIAEPRGPADEVAAEINSVGPGDSMDYRGRSDAQIRAGTTIHLDLGSTIWLYGSGRRAGTLAGEISGSALAPDGWKEGPNYGRSWTAVGPGTSTITVTITADGRRFVIGTVTVVVS